MGPKCYVSYVVILDHQKFVTLHGRLSTLEEIIAKYFHSNVLSSLNILYARNLQVSRLDPTQVTSKSHDRTDPTL